MHTDMPFPYVMQNKVKTDGHRTAGQSGEREFYLDITYLN